MRTTIYFFYLIVSWTTFAISHEDHIQHKNKKEQEQHEVRRSSCLHSRTQSPIIVRSAPMCHSQTQHIWAHQLTKGHVFRWNFSCGNVLVTLLQPHFLWAYRHKISKPYECMTVLFLKNEKKIITNKKIKS